MTSRYIASIVLLIFLLGCNPSDKCSSLQNEVYSPENSNLPDSIRIQFDSALAILNEPVIRGSEFESYRLIYGNTLSNSHSSFLFEKTDSSCTLTYRELYKSRNSQEVQITEEKKILLSDFEWDHLQYLVYKFEYWTEPEYIFIPAADGHGFALEGNRPLGKSCSKLSEKLTIRVNTIKNDKITWLYDELISILDHLYDDTSRTISHTTQNLLGHHHNYDSHLFIHGELDEETVNWYYPSLLDYFTEIRVLGASRVELYPDKGIIVSLLHNTGTFDEMILCTHDQELHLIDHFYIGKSTAFDSSSHTIDYEIIDENTLRLYTANWVGTYKNEGYEVQLVDEDSYLLTINEDGDIIKEE